MRSTSFFLLFILVGTLFLGCATNGSRNNLKEKIDPDHPPQATIKRFRNFVKEQKWRFAYQILSSRTRNCYEFDDFRSFLNRTKPGILIQYRFRTWRINDTSQKNDSNNTAFVQLVHPQKESYKQTYRLRFENDLWRLDWSMAEAFGVPRSVEDCRKK